MPHCTPVRILASAAAAAFVTATAAPPSLAQTAPSSDIQVLELEYAPASPIRGLDLRPGRYLLQLQRQPTGAYEGLLRGPRNEVVAERIVFSASSGCGAGVSAAAVISTRALPAQRGLNVLELEISDAAGVCSLRGTLPNLGLTAPEKPPQLLECEPPEETDQLGRIDSGPVCNIEKWEPPLSAPRPDLKPGPHFQIAGRSYRWVDSVRLRAADAVAFQEGRCLFNYAFLIENAGQAASSPTDASLQLGHRFGLQLDSRSLGGLAPGGLQRIHGRMALPPGTWQVFVHADSSAQVGEWHSQNNARSLLVEVQGPCASTASP